MLTAHTCPPNPSTWVSQLLIEPQEWGMATKRLTFNVIQPPGPRTSVPVFLSVPVSSQGGLILFVIGQTFRQARGVELAKQLGSVCMECVEWVVMHQAHMALNRITLDMLTNILLL